MSIKVKTRHENCIREFTIFSTLRLPLSELVFFIDMNSYTYSRQEHSSKEIMELLWKDVTYLLKNHEIGRAY